jgi:hypothetical protein
MTAEFVSSQPSVSSQVPVWVPLAVAAVALFGVLATQAIAVLQRRLDCRDSRTVQELIWHREQRIAAYTEIITSVNKIRRLTSPSQKKRWTSPGTDSERTHTHRITAEAVQILDGTIAKVEIVGSADTIRTAQDLHLVLINLQRAALEMTLHAITVEEWKTAYRSFRNELDTSTDKLLRKMRADLHVQQT